VVEEGLTNPGHRQRVGEAEKDEEAHRDEQCSAQIEKELTVH
jgi:hypothetical protein